MSNRTKNQLVMI